MSRQLTVEEAEALGYKPARVLATGKTAGVIRMIYTHALYVGINDWGTDRRFCYPDRESAVFALETWDGRGDPPGPWLKEKGDSVERRNPLWSKEQQKFINKD